VGKTSLLSALYNDVISKPNEYGVNSANDVFYLVSTFNLLTKRYQDRDCFNRLWNTALAQTICEQIRTEMSTRETLNCNTSA
jgi:hypothetical protein